MPYYFGEDSPGWDEYMERLEAENLARGPLDRFTYVEPWEANVSVLHFSHTPRPVSERKAAADAGPERNAAPDPGPARRPGIIARIFGAKAPAGLKPRAKIEIGSPEWMENFRAEQKRKAEEALERVAVWAAAFRSAGVRQVLMRYNGGNDEGFSEFEALVMADGSRLTEQDPTTGDFVRVAMATAGVKVDLGGFANYGYLDIFDDAAVALLGPGYGTGPYEMFGAITIDCEACTITDEKDPNRAFPEDAKGA
jgi:hypothetical protein